MFDTAFGSNASYLSWEMRRVQRRLEALRAVRDDPEGFSAFRTEQRLLDEERQMGRRARAAAVAEGVAIPAHTLSERFGLSPADEDLLMVLLTSHLSAGLWSLLLRTQAHILKPYVEVGFALQLVAGRDALLTDRGALEPSGVLLRHGLVSVEPPPEPGAGAGFLQYSVQAPDYVAAAVLGEQALDQRLTAFCELRPPGDVGLVDVVLGDRERRQLDAFVRAFVRAGRAGAAAPDDGPWFASLGGPSGHGKTLLARALASALGRPLLTVRASLLGSERAHMIRLAARNADFLGAILHLDHPERAPGSGELSEVFCAALARYRGMAVVETADAPAAAAWLPSPAHLHLQLPAPSVRQRLEIWETQIPTDVPLAGDVHLPELARTYELSGGSIAAAARWARRRARTEGRPLGRDQLAEGARHQLRSAHGHAAQSDVRLDFDRLVLPDKQARELRELLEACRSRTTVLDDWGLGEYLPTGRGLVALFAGESGTGKTFAAEIIAAKLQLPLRIASVPNIMSKWVGETEKNVQDIFRQARADGSMLLFDEADALFGKRVSVERSQDHYQNVSVNVLLQEIERFDGIVVLTTNLEANMDTAFQRRILFRIQFPAPGAGERETLWRKLLPPHAPIAADIDFEGLAERFELTGGQIKNAVVRAAYRCCAAGDAIDHEALALSAEHQAEAAGKLVRRERDVRVA